MIRLSEDKIGMVYTTGQRVIDECLSASEKWPPFNSAHEGYGVISEEFDELKAHVWMKQEKRDLEAMRKEAIQFALMSVMRRLEENDHT